MAQRTLADFVKEGQRKRLEGVFREEFLAVPCDEGGPQRMVENEDTLRELLRIMLPGLAEPYYQFVSPEVEVLTDYSLTLHIRADFFRDNSAVTLLHGENKASQSRRVRLIQENSNCPTYQTLVRVLRRAGWEYADAWDLRAFVAKSPKIHDTPTGRSIYAPATQIRVTEGNTFLDHAVADENGKKFRSVVAHWDRVKEKWGLGFSKSLYGPSLVRSIVK